jgi:hypothetical protein
MHQRFEAGQFINFLYNPPEPPPKRAYRKATTKMVVGPTGIKTMVQLPAVKAPVVEQPKDKNKEILVLHPNWHNKIHGVDLKRVTPAEVQTLKAVMDPKVKAQIDAGKWPVDGAPNYPLIRDILKRMDPIELIKNPIAFYQQLIKPFIRNKDCYRQYWPQYASSVKVIKESSVQGQVTNPAPLFKKI